MPFSPALLILVFPLASASPATTTAAPTTRRSGPIRPPARSASRARRTAAKRTFPLILQNIHRYFLYLALIFIVLLAHDVWKALWFDDPGTAHEHFGIGVGHAGADRSTSSCSAATPSAATRCGTWSAACWTACRGSPVRKTAYDCVSCLNRAHMLVGVVQPVLGRLRRPLRPPVLDGHLDRLENSLDGRRYQTHEHDVLVIGAGGAGLRAAIEASAAGVSVGLVCKSLLGKAHTVMAEGGIAAALANVDDRDNWKVHFADTMRGGQYLNNWRMAELHAKEAPDRVRELEAWGAVFDRTKDGRILQRNFGGHRYPRLAHVGDRTGLEMIRTLQDHGIHQGIDVHMECTVVTLLKDGDRVAGAFGYDRERGRFALFRAKAVVLATGGIGRAFKITSNSWEYTGDGHALAYHAGADADGHGVRPVPSRPAWSGRRACAASW